MKRSKNSSHLQIAISYARQGFAVLPVHWAKRRGVCSCGNKNCKNIAKHPLTAHGVHDATTDITIIKKWWHDYPNANIGIATGTISKLVVLDVDRRHGGFKSLKALQKQHGRLPAGPSVHSGGGGHHYYFRCPVDGQLKTRRGIAAGVELLMNGSYVVAASSRHASGKLYRRVNGTNFRSLPQLPAWLRSATGNGTTTAPRTPRAETATTPIPEGKRNATLTSLAGVMRGKGMSVKSITAALLADNHARCQPPLAVSEIHQIVNSVSQYERGSSDSNAVPQLKFHTGKEISGLIRQDVEWIAEPLVAVGAITEIAGKVKLGKSTFVTHLACSVIAGEKFLDQPTRKTGGVYLTEQNPVSFRQTLQRAGLLDSANFHAVFWYETVGMDWKDVVQQAVDACKKFDAKLLIIDTLPQFARLPGDSENNAGDALKALEPLQTAAAQGIGVIVIRHERKAGGDVGDSARGSSAFGGAVDTVISIRRAEGNGRRTVRTLHGLSRFSEMPEQIFIELTESGYVNRGTKGDVAQDDARTFLLEKAPKTPKDAHTVNQLMDGSQATRTTLQRAIDELLRADELIRVGTGRKGNPFRYWATGKKNGEHEK